MALPLNAWLPKGTGTVRSINAYAKLHHTQKCGIGIDKVLGRGAFDLDRILELEPEFLGEDHHHHDEDVQSYSFKTLKPLSHEMFQRWMGGLVAVKGPDILRSKRILAFKDEPLRLLPLDVSTGGRAE